MTNVLDNNHKNIHYLIVGKDIPNDELEFLKESSQIDYPNSKIIVVFKDEESCTVSDIPSKNTSSFWLETKRKIGYYPADTNRSGKWLVFMDKTRIDEIWQLIKEATIDGRLGGRSKVSTAKKNPNAYDVKKGVICIYTYDCEDKEDVLRIREELKKIGVTQKISYKTDLDTNKGKYLVSGHKDISKYYI